MIGQKQFGSPAGPEESPASVNSFRGSVEGQIFVPKIFDRLYGKTPAATADDGFGVGGKMTEILLGPSDNQNAWVVEHLLMFTNSGFTTTRVPRATVYVNTAEDQNVIDIADPANRFVIDRNAGIRMPANTSLLFRWVNMDAGAQAVARIYYVGGIYQTVPFGRG